MKKPQKPMKKPEKPMRPKPPTRTVMKRETSPIEEGVTLADILKAVGDVPPESIRVEAYNGGYDAPMCYIFEWQVEVENKHYAKEVVAYNKRLERYHNHLARYHKALEAYVIWLKEDLELIKQFEGS